MAVIDGVLFNNDDLKSYKLRGVSNVRVTTTQPALTIPFVSNTSADTYLFRFTGQLQTVTLNFAIFNDGTDTSDGDSIVTVADQINYLDTIINVAGFDKDFDLSLYSFWDSSTITGVIENLEVSRVAGQPNLAVGTLTFKRGQITSI